MEEKIAEIVRDVFERDMLKALQDDETRDERVIKAIAQALSGICVEVTELEWQELFQRRSEADPAEELIGYEAEAPIGFYLISLGDDYATTPNYEKLRANQDDMDPESEYSFDPDKLKRACQRDFASSIASCLKTRTVEEVRAEELERVAGAIQKEWITCASEAADFLRSLQQEGESDA